MPTYEYLCQSCSHRFETWQKITAEPLTTCPRCEGPVRRVLFPAGVVFKGSGFYKTDHARNGHASANGEASKTESASAETTKTSEGAASSNGTASSNGNGATSSTATSESKTSASTATK